MQTDKPLSNYQVRWACLHKCGLSFVRLSRRLSYPYIKAMTGENEYGARSRVLLKVKLGTPQNELRRNMKTPDQDSQSPGNDSNRPSDEIHFELYMSYRFN